MTDTGFARVPHSVLRAAGLSGYAKLLYALLEDRVNSDGTCRPSLALLCEESGWSKPTVLKAIGELETAGLLERQRRGRTLVNVYTLKSTTLTSRSQPGLPLKSTSFTAEVNHVDPKENHLRRTTEGDSTTNVVASLSPDPEVKSVSLTSEPPPEYAAFDAELRGLPGYTPTGTFWKTLPKYAALDLAEEGLKMASWLRSKRGRQCTTAFVLNWLKRATEDRSAEHAGRVSRNGTGDRSRLRPDHGAAEQPRPANPFAKYG